MKCKISCSFGEIVDKATILRIKKQKASDPAALQNIKTELETIERENPAVLTNDVLFDKLAIINKILWDLEDNIRLKSSKKEYDKAYIRYAEQIHIQNTNRYNVKREINEKYNSFLKEEKIHSLEHSTAEHSTAEHSNAEHSTAEHPRELKNNFNHTTISIPQNQDLFQLHYSAQLCSEGKYPECLRCLEDMVERFKNYNIYDEFYINLLLSYRVICSIYTKPFPYSKNIKKVIDQIDILRISPPFKKYCKNQYALMCLARKDYREAGNYVNYMNTITGPNINNDNMGFFTESDMSETSQKSKPKTLLIYDGGGIGDKFMLSRFIPRLCKTYANHKIIFLIPGKLEWFFNSTFKDIPNITLISNPRAIKNFDYHCSLMRLITYLKLGYNDIYFDNFIKNIEIQTTPKCQRIIDSFKKRTFIINWKGNPTNTHEKYNRMMKLENAKKLFNIKTINWIVIAKDLTDSERRLLKKCKVNVYGDQIDNDKAFYDTICILRNVDGVVTTDTSLPHLSLSLGIKTYVLLTKGCEWRWTQDNTTNWYPNANLLRQNEPGNWTEPIEKLSKILLNL